MIPKQIHGKHLKIQRILYTALNLCSIIFVGLRKTIFAHCIIHGTQARLYLLYMRKHIKLFFIGLLNLWFNAAAKTMKMTLPRKLLCIQYMVKMNSRNSHFGWLLEFSPLSTHRLIYQPFIAYSIKNWDSFATYQLNVLRLYHLFYIPVWRYANNLFPWFLWFYFQSPWSTIYIESLISQLILCSVQKRMWFIFCDVIFKLYHYAINFSTSGLHIAVMYILYRY